jgi:hypothetical protein
MNARRTVLVGRCTSIDTLGGTGVSPVLRFKHGQDARATRQNSYVGPLRVWLVLGGIAALALAWLSVGGSPVAAAEKAAAGAEKPPEAAKPALPAHRVVAYYFHRTERCATCLKVGEYLEESLKTGMAREVKDGRVVLVFVDFQDPKNKAHTDYYKIAGPTLVLADVRKEKVVAWKPAPKLWSLVGNKEKFSKYLQAEVRSLLEAK